MNIITDRLLLVPVSEEHIQNIYENFNDEVTEYMIPTAAKNISETIAVVNTFIQQCKNNTDYVYAITLRSNSEFVGLVGLHDLKDIPKLGIWTKVQSHGNHYGREAIGGVINYASSLGIKKLCYPVDRRNISSKKIPIFYGGILAANCKQIKTPDGRTLEEEIYEIEVC